MEQTTNPKKGEINMKKEMNTKMNTANSNMTAEEMEALKAVEEFESGMPEKKPGKSAKTASGKKKPETPDRVGKPQEKNEIAPQIKKELKRRAGIISREMNRIEESYVNIAFQLYWIRENKAYKLTEHKNVYELAENEFNIKKSTCGNLIGIIENFSKKDPEGNALEELDEKYKAFKMSQLVAMLSMSDKARIEVTADMSVRAINQKKKEGGRAKNEKEAGKIIEGSAREIQRTVYASFRDYHQYQSRLEDTDAQTERVFKAYEKKGKRVLVEISFTEID